MFPIFNHIHDVYSLIIFIMDLDRRLLVVKLLNRNEENATATLYAD